MQAALYWPFSMRTRCLGERDLQRLSTQYHVISTDSDDLDGLLEKWPTWMSDTQVIMTGWGTPPITEAMLDQAPHLRFIMHAAGSLKVIVPPSTWERGIRVASCNEALGELVAETTLGMIIAGLKGFFPANTETHAGRWKINDFDIASFRTRELYELTIGIIGASKTGRHLIKLLQAFHVDVVVFDPYLSETEARAMGVERVSLDELMSRSDVVSLHAPGMKSTRHMLGRRQFKAMKDGAIFINTARGMIVDEKALGEELQTGRIWAFIDVTDPEPPANDHPFRTLPNVILTPHIAGATSNGCRRLGRSAVDQLLDYAGGQPVLGEVTADLLPQLA